MRIGLIKKCDAPRPVLTSRSHRGITLGVPFRKIVAGSA
jgi:hypothetical protein